MPARVACAWRLNVRTLDVSVRGPSIVGVLADAQHERACHIPWLDRA